MIAFTSYSYGVGLSVVQGHPTNLFVTLTVPQRNLAGWHNSRCSDELTGKFGTAEGFVLEFEAYLGGKALKSKVEFPPPFPSEGRIEAFCATPILKFDVRCRKLSFFCLLAAHFAAGWETNQFYLPGWEISCVCCWGKGTDNFFPAILKNT